MFLNIFGLSFATTLFCNFSNCHLLSLIMPKFKYPCHGLSYVRLQRNGRTGSGPQNLEISHSNVLSRTHLWERFSLPWQAGQFTWETILSPVFKCSHDKMFQHWVLSDPYIPFLSCPPVGGINITLSSYWLLCCSQRDQKNDFAPTRLLHSTCLIPDKKQS